MQIVDQGKGEIFTKITPDDFRSHMRVKMEKVNSDKRMDIKEAVSRFMKDGYYISIGGCSIVRLPMAFVHEVLRQGFRNLSMASGTRNFDVDFLLDNDRIATLDIGYILGLEMLGIPLYTRTRVQDRLKSGELKISEWTNGTMAWRHKAGAMGIPFLPVRSLAGTDTFKYGAGKQVECPFTGIKVVLVPAIFCDTCCIHVHRADKLGNCQIDGMLNEDYEKARSAKNLIITTEKIVDTDEIRKDGSKTVIPQFFVDAVVEVPNGAYPTNMPGLYYMDLDHLKGYAKAAGDRSGESSKKYYDEYVFGTKDFNEYLEKCGGKKRIEELKKIELMEGRS